MHAGVLRFFPPSSPVLVRGLVIDHVRSQHTVAEAERKLSGRLLSVQRLLELSSGRGVTNESRKSVIQPHILCLQLVTTAVQKSERRFYGTGDEDSIASLSILNQFEM